MPPTPPRDSQRSRVYRAETPLRGRRLPELDHCRAFCDEVVGSLWWSARFPTKGLAAIPRLRPGNGARQAFYREDPGHPTITLPRRYRTAPVVLHELVHWALAEVHDLPNHGSTFTRLLLDATAEFLGDTKREQLAASYAEQKVKIGPPARVSPAGAYDYTWDERLRRGRGQCFTIGWAGDGSTTGLLISRAHRAAELWDGQAQVRIPEREIWSVVPAPLSAVTGTAPRATTS